MVEGELFMRDSLGAGGVRPSPGALSHLLKTRPVFFSRGTDGAVCVSALGVACDTGFSNDVFKGQDNLARLGLLAQDLPAGEGREGREGRRGGSTGSLAVYSFFNPSLFLFVFLFFEDPAAK